jgi:hypothetical protein
MPIDSLNPALSSYLGTVQRPGTPGTPGTAGPSGPDGARTRVEPARPQPAAGRPLAVNIAAPAQSALPAAAPAGTDPDLWSVLTSEERTFFAKIGSMGPLTYGRLMQTPNAPPSIRGGRLDVKV